MRLVLDTGTVVSGLLWGGNPQRVLELAEDPRIREDEAGVLNPQIGLPHVP